VGRGGDTGKQGDKCQEDMEGLRERWINDHFHIAHYIQIKLHILINTLCQ